MNIKIKNNLISIIELILFVGGLYFWLIQSNIYASNFIKIYIWIHFIIGTSFMFLYKHNLLFKQKHNSKITIRVASIILLILTIYGHWEYGLFYTIGTLNMVIAYNMNTKYNKKILE